MPKRQRSTIQQLEDVHNHIHTGQDSIGHYKHSHIHNNKHTHTHKHTKAVLNRMSRLIGHLESTKRMIENGRDCSEILIQLSAVSSAINGVSRIILKDHMEHCMVEAIKENDKEALENLKNAIDRFLK